MTDFHIMKESATLHTIRIATNASFFASWYYYAKYNRDAILLPFMIDDWCKTACDDGKGVRDVYWLPHALLRFLYTKALVTERRPTPRHHADADAAHRKAAATFFHFWCAILSCAFKIKVSENDIWPGLLMFPLHAFASGGIGWCAIIGWRPLMMMIRLLHASWYMYDTSALLFVGLMPLTREFLREHTQRVVRESAKMSWWASFSRCTYHSATLYRQHARRIIWNAYLRRRMIAAASQ